ncbi:MAG: prepilin-type N-terminal cleavage/methylation domain-containing protein [Pseudomonadota bacterium]
MTLSSLSPRWGWHRPAKRKSERGFSTLEAMVAIAILGVALLPLYAFQNTIVSGSGKVEGKFNEQQHHALVSTYLKGLVPEGLNAGSAQFENVSVQWKLDPISPPRSVLAGTGVPGRFRVTLMRIQYTIETPQLSRPLIGEVERLVWEETSSFFSSVDR